MAIDTLDYFNIFTLNNYYFEGRKRDAQAMRKVLIYVIIMMGLLISSFTIYAQEEQEIREEESAAVSLEDYSDEFQENFFEALKQKGIENYDKAINLLLKCKLLEPDNAVVDHELAKVYLADKQYIQAQEYGITALISEPESLWYLDTLVEILQKQGSTVETVKSEIPFVNSKLQENLALVYYRKGNYESALNILKGIKKSAFSEILALKIKDSIEQQEAKSQKASFTVSNNASSDPLGNYKARIQGFLRTNNLPILEQLSDEALESYPSQPFFYYAKGYALNKKAKHKEAIEILEAALDYLLDDVSLANKIYKELADAYTALNNISKANMYLSKVKPGF